MPGKLTTHVLDTRSGRPAAGVWITCHRLVTEAKEGPVDRKEFLAEATTNDDGRLDAPLLAGEALQPGIYELTFHIGSYFASQDGSGREAGFLDQVPVRFRIGGGEQSYHIPLLVTPWSYTTYRGS